MRPAAEPLHELEAPRGRLSRLPAAAGAITTSSGRQTVRTRSTLERITPTPAARRSTVCPQTR